MYTSHVFRCSCIEDLEEEMNKFFEEYEGIEVLQMTQSIAMSDDWECVVVTILYK